MTKDEVLKYLDIRKLPNAVEFSKQKCPVLVERFSGKRDYAVANNGGVCVDKKAVSAVVKIVEFYPEVQEEKVIEGEQKEPEVKEPDIPAVSEPEKPKVDMKPEPKKEVMSRSEMIEFLVKKRNQRKKVEEMDDEALKKLVKVYER